MTIPKDRLAELRQLEQNATPGPWVADTTEPHDCVIWSATEDFLCNVGSSNVVPVDAPAILFNMDKRNAVCAVAARNALPELLDEVESLQDENLDLRQRLRCGSSDDLEPVSMMHWRSGQ